MRYPLSLWWCGSRFNILTLSMAASTRYCIVFQTYPHPPLPYPSTNKEEEKKSTDSEIGERKTFSPANSLSITESSVAVLWIHHKRYTALGTKHLHTDRAPYQLIPAHPQPSCSKKEMLHSPGKKTKTGRARRIVGTLITYALTY